MIAELASAASILVAAAAILAGFVVMASTRNVRLALSVLLELLTAAGLLRLVGASTLTPVLTAAGIIAIRQIATLGFAFSSANLTDFRRRAELPLRAWRRR